MNCEQGFPIGTMAGKMKMMKLLEEIRGFAEFTNRRPQARPVGLFLVQMRSHLTHTTVSNPRRNIAITGPAPSDLPHPVKITHLKPAEERRTVADER